MTHVFTVHDFEDSDGLSAVLDIFADDKLAEVVETLLGNEGVPGGSGKNDLVVVWAVSEHFRAVGGDNGGASGLQYVAEHYLERLLIL